MKGLIFAAGIGSRLRPWTDNHPKALVEVGGKAMLQRVIENMKLAGISQIVINIHHKADQIIDFISTNRSFGIDIAFSDERECLLDTGGAVVRAAGLLAGSEHVLIHNADIYTDLNLMELINAHRRSGADATLLTSLRKSSRKLLVNASGRLKGWINTATGETLPGDIADIDSLSQVSFNGIHIISPDVIEWLSSHAPSKVFPIIPQYIAMSVQLHIGTFIPQHRYSWVDIGRPETLELARNIAHDS